ncbi:unnamed protein product [Camellia sinensis]
MKTLWQTVLPLENKNENGEREREASVQGVQSLELRSITAATPPRTVAQIPRPRTPSPVAGAPRPPFSPSPSWPPALVPRRLLRCEGMAAIPVVKCCIERRPDINILMTTTTLSAFEVIKNQLPSGVLYQFAPLDIPAAMDAFLGHWKPNAIMLMESELWPNLIMCASKNGIALSTTQAIRFQLLQAPPSIINFSGDLKYATEAFDLSNKDKRSIENLQLQLSPRRVWMASSIHRGEEEGVHKLLKLVHPDVVTIIVPRHPQHGQEIALELQKEGVSVALRSRDDKLMPGTNIYVVDTLGARGVNGCTCVLDVVFWRNWCTFEEGELRDFYKLTPIAVIGGSFLPDLTGHNISEAAAAGCAVLTGHHVGHFAHMVQEMQRLNPLSVLQVSGKLELEKALCEFFSNTAVLEARRAAARQAFHALSSGIIENIWNILHFHVFRKALKNYDNRR